MVSNREEGTSVDRRGWTVKTEDSVTEDE
jgi:hypothetical protein